MEGTISEYCVSDRDDVIAFMREAFGGMGRGLQLQGKHADLTDIYGAYLRDGGAFFVLRIEEEVAGTAALRPLGEGIAELKRLYLKKEFQGMGFGEQLLQKVIDQAKRGRFAALRLDTSSRSPRAIRLFERSGFQSIARYNDNPDAEFFYELKL